MSEPFLFLGVLEYTSASSGNDLSNKFLVSSLLLSIRFSSDGGVNFLVNIFASLSFVCSKAFFPLGEVSLEFS